MQARQISAGQVAMGACVPPPTHTHAHTCSSGMHSVLAPMASLVVLRFFTSSSTSSSSALGTQVARACEGWCEPSTTRESRRSLAR